MFFKKQLKILSFVLLLFSLLLFLPFIIAINYDSHIESQFFAAFIGAGLVLSVIFKVLSKSDFKFNHHESILLVFLTWLIVSCLASIPFIYLLDIGVVNSFFEAVSGLTTTGATTIFDVESLPKSILIYRSLLSFIGGLGLIYFIYLFIRKNAGGNLTIIENGRGNEKNISLKINSKYVIFTISLYFIGTIIFTVLFMLSGLSFIDSLVYSFGGISTGGFSSKNIGASFFSDNNLFLIFLTALMFFASINFYIYFNIVRGKINIFRKNVEFKILVLFVVVLTVIIFALTFFSDAFHFFFTKFIKTLFLVISFISTSGYTNDVFNILGASSLLILFTLMFIGGSSSSNALGLRIFRLNLIFDFIKSSIIRKIHPKVPLKIRGDNYNMSEITGRSLAYFSSLVLLLFIEAVVLAFNNFSVYESFTGAVAIVSNTGVGAGVFHQQSGFLDLSDFSKVISSLIMLLSRLEGIAILSLLTTTFWRKKA